MQNYNGERFAIFVIAEGGKIVSELNFADPSKARDALDDVARDHEDAKRIILIDRQDGRIMGEHNRT